MAYLSQTFLLKVVYLLKILIPPWLRKISKFIVFTLLENAFASQKIESTDFYLSVQVKLSPGFLSLTPPSRGTLLVPPGSAFSKIYSPQQQGGQRDNSKKFPFFMKDICN